MPGLEYMATKDYVFTDFRRTKCVCTMHWIHGKSVKGHTSAIKTLISHNEYTYCITNGGLKTKRLYLTAFRKSFLPLRSSDCGHVVPSVSVCTSASFNSAWNCRSAQVTLFLFGTRGQSLSRWHQPCDLDLWPMTRGPSKWDMFHKHALFLPADLALEQQDREVNWSGSWVRHLERQLSLAAIKCTRCQSLAEYYTEFLILSKLMNSANLEPSICTFLWFRI